MLFFEFMRHAFLGSALVSFLSGSIGWFLLVRRQAFAAHALSHIGFSGAAGAVWLGFSPILGMIFSSLIAGLIIGLENEGYGRVRVQRDGTIGLVLAASLGLGTLFLHEANGSSSITTTLLFGNILGIDDSSLITLTCVGIICLVGLAILGRVLLFSSLSPEVARAKGVPVQVVSLCFMALTALACSACSEIAGSLLAFSLIVGPAATVLRLGLEPFWGITISIGLALSLSWASLIFSWFTDIPVSFWIGTGATLCYIVANIKNKLCQKR